MKEEGIVANVEKGRVVVEIAPHKECRGCKTCGASRPRRVVVDKNSEGLKEGDRVEVEIDPSVMLKVYMLIYAMPLAAFILAILVAHSALQKPAFSFIIAIAVTGITYLGIASFMKKSKNFSPKIIKREEI